jgi:uncharacterized Zn-binding protein involved in type VI secretion
MSKLITVDGDKVEGTDKHNVSGTGTNPNSGSTVPFTGIADFDYKGKMTDELSDFVNIGGKPVALVTSKSSLNPGEDSTGGHAPTSAKNIVAIPPPPITPGTETVLAITDAIGTGIPSSGTGSTFVKVGGDAVLLDGDKIDTCDGLSIPMNSTVTAENQDFVNCSE